MGRVHQLAGTAGSRLSERTYAAYYTSIARTGHGAAGTVRHRLRPEIGAGTIESTSLCGGFELVRYDVAFGAVHRVGYAFPDDHFELEYCLDGRMHVRELSGGLGALRAGTVALSPRHATSGVVTHDAGAGYRAVSITGTWTGLAARLADLGAAPLPDNRPDKLAREQYLGRSAALHRLAGPLEELFRYRSSSPGRLLFLESRLLAVLAALTDELTVAGPPAHAGHRVLDEHEVAAVHLAAELLWRERHAPPTLAALARASSMSVRRLSEGFRTLYGTPVMEYHRRRCLDRAAILLTETDWPVARIAHEVGYASPSNFGYAFRRARGTTPARFRLARR